LWSAHHLRLAADQQLAREAGFDRHLTKPIPSQEIEGVLASLK
jgi:hypothetical protein